jgi:hypothetical protein
VEDYCPLCGAPLTWTVGVDIEGVELECLCCGALWEPDAERPPLLADDLRTMTLIPKGDFL